MYIIRHQEKGITNCLSTKGIDDTVFIAYRLPNCNDIVTCKTYHNHHVRCIQTASILGTHANKNVKVQSKDDTFDDNVLIVWHHEDMEELLSALLQTKIQFKWPEDNYTGMIIVKPKTNDFVF